MTPIRPIPRKAAGFRLGLALLPIAALAACSEGEFTFGSRNADADGPAPIGATRLVERDVEAPEIFEVTTDGLWDGRPSLGGVWVAHPDVTDPERVIIRNDENGRFVIGALFRRERANPGPELQISSDAAASLGVLAGDPTLLNVTALRREEVSETDEAEEAGLAPTEELARSAAPGAITTTALDGGGSAIAADVAAAIASAPRPEDYRPPTPNPLPAAAPAAARAPAGTPAASSGSEDAYVQIGIFSVQENATNTGQALRSVGLEPTIYDQSTNGRQFWRVVVGPANDAATRDAILANVRELGFDDAFFVNR